MRLLILLIVSGCYDPGLERACEVACGTGNSCPAQLTCGADGMCREKTGTDCSMRDAAGEAGTVCVSGRFLSNVCSAPQPITLSGTVDINTDSDTRCIAITQADTTVVCAIMGSSINVTGTVFAHGARPLALVSTGTIDVSGTIDVASHRMGAHAGMLAAGANHSSCTDKTMAGFKGDGGGQGGGGGAGGTFGIKGGNGGGGQGANGGVGAVPLAIPTVLRGGCNGGNGGGNGASAGGAAGDGGGALYLLAVGNVTITGTGLVNTSGAGGGLGPGGGGGGAGAGGMLALESAATLRTDTGARIFSIGGGGGGGGTNGGASGMDGNDPLAAFTGNGGAKGDLGGDGGKGDPTGGATGGGALGSGGAGGGGGGGFGIIFAIGQTKTLASGTIAPPPM